MTKCPHCKGAMVAHEGTKQGFFHCNQCGCCMNEKEELYPGSSICRDQAAALNKESELVKVAQIPDDSNPLEAERQRLNEYLDASHPQPPAEPPEPPKPISRMTRAELIEEANGRGLAVADDATVADIRKSLEEGGETDPLIAERARGDAYLKATQQPEPEPVSTDQAPAEEVSPVEPESAEEATRSRSRK